MAAFNYEYKTPGLFKVSADVAGGICEELQSSEQGLSPATLLDASRDESAPLHGEFEWDDAVAGEKYRLYQAGTLIRNLTIVSKRSDGSEVKDRGFQSLPGGKSQYTTLSNALSRQDLREHMIEQARLECKQFISKYKRIQELSGVTSAMEAFINNPAI